MFCYLTSVASLIKLKATFTDDQFTKKWEEFMKHQSCWL